MIEKENEKTPVSPICLEILTSNLYFTSDNHLYHRNCFDKLNFKRFENNFKTKICDLDGFSQDGFNRKGFDRDGFNKNGID